MMLYAATKNTMDGYNASKEEFKVLHSLLQIGAHGGMRNVSFPNDFSHSVLLLAKFIMKERAGMFRERDEGGSLPIHIAVMGAGLLRCDVGEREKLEVDADEEEQGDQEAQMDVDIADGDGGQDEQNAAPQQEGPAPGDAENDQVDNDPDEEDIEDDFDEADMEDDHEGSSSVSSGMEIMNLLLEQYPASIRLFDAQTRSLPIHLVLKHNPLATETIDLFLRLYPQSVTMPNGEGRLPIHIALLHNSPSWERVLELAPNTLEKRDIITGLFPFQLAALSSSSKTLEDASNEKISEEDEELESLTTCFRLLRMNPHLASGLAEASTSEPHPAELRVTKLEEENKLLRQRMQELEYQLMQMQLVMQASMNGNALKKRKSFNAMDYFRQGEGM